MELKEKMNFLKEQGLTIKFVANALRIKQSTLYKYLSDNYTLSSDITEKIDLFLDNILDLFNTAETVQMKPKYEDISNQKFNHLTALYPVGPSKFGAMQWACQCDCGNPILRITTARNLKTNQTVSCGCTRIKYGGKNFIDLTGKKFGKLTVINRSENSNDNRVQWLCQCECGAVKKIKSTSLISGKTKSCGCITSSLGEENIEKILQENNINYIKEYSFNDLKSPRNYKLRFDFALFDNNENLISLLEFDGKQHNEPGHFNETQEEYEYRITCDKIKNNYCNENNIPLIRIPYSKRDSLALKDLIIYD